jgi:peptide/nickel transport system permease protein
MTGRRRSHRGSPLVLAALRTRRGALSAALAGLVVLIAVVGPFVASHSPTELVGAAYAPPGAGLPLGADSLGRDVLTRTLWGGWQLILMASLATLGGVALGTIAGISAAYLRGWRDGLIMRSVDVLLAFPQLVLALLLVSVIGAKAWLLVLAVAIGHAPQVARVIRSATLDISERDFVRASELNGTSAWRVMRVEILPNLTGPLMVELGLRMTFSIIVIAGLSFIGFGQQPPNPSWGLMTYENRIGVQVNPWGVVAPVALIALLTIGVNTFTDTLARVASGGGRSRTAAQEDDPLLASETAVIGGAA